MGLRQHLRINFLIIQLNYLRQIGYYKKDKIRVRIVKLKSLIFYRQTK